MISRLELKNLAKESLKGNWGVAIGTFLLYMLVSYALGVPLSARFS